MSSNQAPVKSKNFLWTKFLLTSVLVLILPVVSLTPAFAASSAYPSVTSITASTTNYSTAVITVIGTGLPQLQFYTAASGGSDYSNFYWNDSNWNGQAEFGFGSPSGSDGLGVTLIKDTSTEIQFSLDGTANFIGASDVFDLGLGPSTGSGALAVTGQFVYSTGQFEQIPAPPSGFSATNVARTSALLSWNATSGAQSYNIYSSSGTLLATTTGTSYQLSGLTPTTSYTYSLAAVSSGGIVGTQESTTFQTSTYFNQTTGLSAFLDPGTLTLTAPSLSSSFTPIVLNGQVQTTLATLSNWTVSDATGTGDGWNVQVQASQFTEQTPSGGFATGTSAYQLPQGSLSLVGTRSVLAGSGSTPVNSTGGPNFAVTNPLIDVSTPLDFVQAQSGYGMGTYTVQEPASGLSLVIDPSTTKVDQVNYAGVPTPYETTITFSVISGP